jgi:hypothetical protein
VDGDYDFSVFGHEFGHMIENRMIGKGVGGRQGTHAGAMGEAFGDFDALEVMNALHIAPVPGSDRYTEGAYVTGNPYNGIRDFLAGRPMGGAFPEPGQNPDTDPLNYGEYGFDLAGTGTPPREGEVHADGEIWIAVQIDLRDLFLGRYPSSGPAQDVACVRGQLAASACPGDRRWLQDYYDAMVMMPRNPTMAQARDAMLAADVGRFGGANQDLLWQGFAMRGFGQFQNTKDNADVNPTPDFSSPMASNATINFFADNKGNTLVPVNAKIYVGDYQSRVTQIADTDPSTTPSATPGTNNLDNTAQFVPDASNPRWSSYNFIAVAPGFGAVRFNVGNLQSGEVRNITIHFPPNFASSSQAATISGDTLGTNTDLANVLDDNEGTNDGQTGAPAGGRWFVITLGDVGPDGSAVKRLGVSAQLVLGNNRFTALRSFDAYTCRAARTRRTRPATAPSMRAGRRSSRPCPMRSRRSTQGPSHPTCRCASSTSRRTKWPRTSSSWSRATSAPARPRTTATRTTTRTTTRTAMPASGRTRYMSPRCRSLAKQPRWTGRPTQPDKSTRTDSREGRPAGPLFVSGVPAMLARP